MHEFVFSKSESNIVNKNKKPGYDENMEVVWLREKNEDCDRINKDESMIYTSDRRWNSCEVLCT